MITLKREKGAPLTVYEMDDNLSELYYNRVTLNTDQVVKGVKTFAVPPLGSNEKPLNPNQAVTAKYIEDNMKSEMFISYEKPINPDPSEYKYWLQLSEQDEIIDYFLRDPDVPENWKLLSVKRMVVSYNKNYVAIVLSTGETYLYGGSDCSTFPVVGTSHFSPFLLTNIDNVTKIIDFDYNFFFVTENGVYGRYRSGKGFYSSTYFDLIPGIKDVEFVTGVYAGIPGGLHRVTLSDNTYQYFVGTTLTNLPSLAIKTKFESYDKCLLVLDDDSAWMIGNNVSGSLGCGITDLQYILPTQISVTNIKDVHFNQFYTVIEKTSGEVLTSGPIPYSGHNASVSVFTQLTPEVTSPKKIVSSETKLFIISQNDELYTCGYNAYGQLANGDKVTKNILSKNSNITSVKGILTNEGYDCNSTVVLFNDGLVKGYGQSKPLNFTYNNTYTVGVDLMTNISELIYWNADNYLVTVNNSGYFEGYGPKYSISDYHTYGVSVLRKVDVIQTYNDYYFKHSNLKIYNSYSFNINTPYIDHDVSYFESGGYFVSLTDSKIYLIYDGSNIIPTTVTSDDEFHYTNNSFIYNKLGTWYNVAVSDIISVPGTITPILDYYLMPLETNDYCPG